MEPASNKEKEVFIPESKLVGETGLGYIKRDNGVKGEEEMGLIEFIVVKNDKTL
eukprot:CAMPEP_0202961246 /NCGR_PEP_ID=MMETSP1396-20130829/5299_1 /ASSEMBLY_ACC=CAM_ASM_000872 /TAXON_ID= /ORGANISM="Pseudokeronopsis sp., Strain Brazil" /LENGTH=53 /DNA_ID=CAMNT_0049680923 /DNA_START=20 /DNA_END=181 /DNA_ORIENTATION=+